MSAGKHTPGPWMPSERFGIFGAIKGGVTREYFNGPSQDQLFMVCSVAEDNGGLEATNANARLIAAAPELLHAAQMGHQDSPGMPAGDLLAAANVLRNHMLDDLAERLEAKHAAEFAAIAKATGSAQ